MERARLGDSNLLVSRLCLGGSAFGRRVGQDAATDVVRAAIDEGVNFIDTAASYNQSEEFIGRAIAGTRDRLVIATKFGSAKEDPPPGADGYSPGSTRYIRASVERSLRRLRTDHIDLFYMHGPDDECSTAETLAELSRQQDLGNVRAYGLANVTPEQLVDAWRVAEGAGLHPPVVIQLPASPFRQAPLRGVEEACVDHGVCAIPYRVLEFGALASDSKGRSGQMATDSFRRYQRAFVGFCRDRRLSPVAVAVAMMLQSKAVSSVLLGSSSAAQVRDNCRAFNDLPGHELLAEVPRPA